MDEQSLGQAKLLRRLEERGYRGRVVAIHRLRDLQEEIESRHRADLFDERFYRQRLTGFTFEPPKGLPEARSLIVVAAPQPQIRFTFTWDEERVGLVVPPTYLHWQETDGQIEDLLARVLAPAGYQVAQIALPKKLLAVRSGLTAYGRNNVTYVPGMGSFYRLAAFASDLPCPADGWQEAAMMERCQTCRACLHNCPTGAITAERFLLHAERCITFHNEEPGDVPFPAWMDPAWHNCLVGCLHCQSVCPENKEVLASVEDGAEFTAEETALLLDGVSLDRLPAAMAERLQRWDLVDLLDVLPRNLQVLL
jgi:epoxyqueuosine reductase